MRHPAAAFLALALLLRASPCLALEILVVDRFDDVISADGCDISTENDCSLRGAIRKANQSADSSTVVLPDGLYPLTLEGASEDAAASGDLDFTPGGGDLTVQAEPGAHPIVQQLTADRILDVRFGAGDILLQGPLTLLGGSADNGATDDRGGSLRFFHGASLTMESIHFIGGTAAASSGCLEWTAPSSPGTLSLTNVSFADCNSGGNGGAFFIQSSDSTVAFDGVLARGNVAASNGGGGLFFGGSTPISIERSSFENNTAGAASTTISQGGGLFLGSGSFFILDSTIASNVAGRLAGTSSSGGGIFIQNSQLLVRNTTLSANQSLAPLGGGTDLAAQNSNLGISFSTIKAHGSGMPASLDLATGSTLTLFSSIIEGECMGGGITSIGFNVEHPMGGAPSTFCSLDHVSDVTTTKPLLRPLAGYGGPTPTHALLPSADGTTLLVASTSCPPTDQRGAQRLGLFCHSGAYEANSHPPGPEIFSDGFESGDAAAWSASFP
ncbi:MAG: right-handed parallel beta-helix repeat-containing protein [Deltaproteobacteria bacterium]|nr:right-handed parallel beta-helix repeat-containing protein [Deltaproteobacteria bacterium]